MRTLDGKAVVITGAASGIGRALAVHAADRGAVLALCDLDQAGLDETVALAREAGARQVHATVLDVADRAAMAAYAGDVHRSLGRVNMLVNNAGVTLWGDFADAAYDDMEWIVGVNFWGTVHGIREFLPHLVASGDGHVVTISSLCGLISLPGQSLYSATKYAVRGLTEALREEMLVAGHPVGVTVVHPGGIRTAIARNARHSEGHDGAASTRRFDERLARLEADEAARIIVRGVLAGKPRILVGADAHALHQLSRVAGAHYQDVIALVGRRRRAVR